MARRDSELIKNTFVLGLGQLVPKMISLVILPILTKYLTTSEYGIYDFILSIASLLIPLVSLQIQQGAFRYLLDSTQVSDKKRFVTNSLVFTLVTSAIVFTLVGLVCMMCGYGICYFDCHDLFI